MSRSNQPTREQFLKDVEKHQMRVVRDEGIHRHLHFGVPGTSCMHFQIITFPGYLVYVGDMGSFTFQRLDDMFQFFRTRPEREAAPYINEGYWAEKLEAHDKHGGHEKWSADAFKRMVVSDFRDHCRDMSLLYIDRLDLWDALKDEVLSAVDDGEGTAYSAASKFKHGSFEFHDLWEHNHKEYTYRFVWACYAIAWAVMQYDAAKAEVVAA